MHKNKTCIIKFPIEYIRALRGCLLEDLEHEQFAVLFAKTEIINDSIICNVVETRVFSTTDILSQTIASVHLDREKIFDMLQEIEGRLDVDTIIDVHTHPFNKEGTFFSLVDDRDEYDFARYIAQFFPSIRYASIVLSQTQYLARFWDANPIKPTCINARIVTANARELIPSSQPMFQGDTIIESSLFCDEDAQFNRSTLALGLDAMRRIVNNQRLAIIGAGGLGSIIAENLIHSGFREIHLIDNDKLSISNLNRIVGATHDDAVRQRLKVDCLAEHLNAINPDAKITAHTTDITCGDMHIVETMAQCDWVILATDNHSSRFAVQNICTQFFTPLISAGVNITVNTQSNLIEDMSGEVITVRPGDNVCLHCLGRLDPTRIAAESHPDSTIRRGLQHYVPSLGNKEPAVKTLNSIVASIATDILVNHYTDYQQHEVIWVYENNLGKAIYPDRESLFYRKKNCKCQIN